MQVVLVMFTAEGERRSFSIARDTTVIGRRNDCDLCIPVGDVSRKHCRLIKTEDAVRLEDLGSSNGTYVNGQRVQESPLNPGDWIQVGPVQFCVRLDGVPSDEDLAQRSAGQAEETSTGLASIDSETSTEEPSPQASRSGDVYSEAPPESAGENPNAAGEEISLEEVPLEDIPLEEDSSADQAAPIDALDLEEITDHSDLEDINLDTDASQKTSHPH